MGRAALLGYATITVGNLIFLAVDYLLYPQQFAVLATARAVVIATCLVCAIVTASASQLGYLAGSLCLAVATLDVLAVNFLAMDGSTRYVFFIPLVFLFAANFIPSTFFLTLVQSLAGTALYLCSALLSPAPPSGGVLAFNLAVLATSSGVSAFTVLLKNGAFRREWELAQSLEQKAQELQKANHELQQAALDLRAADRAKNEFFANVNHELRTPLTMVLAHTDLAEARLVELGVHDVLEHIKKSRRSGLRLAELVADMLDMTRLESKKMVLEIKRVDLRDLSQNMATDIAELAARKKVRLKLQVEDDGGGAFSVDGDAKQLDRVLINLLTNALKFTGPDGLVTLALRSSGEHVIMEVADTGAGISAKALPHIFERGYQELRSSINVGEGLGIGLYLVKLIVEAHQGEIRVVSREGEGTRMSVLLKRAS